MVDILSTVYPMEAINQLRLGGAANFYRRNYGNIHKLGYWSLHLWWNAAHLLAVWFWNRTANRETNRKHRNRTGTEPTIQFLESENETKRTDPHPVISGIAPLSAEFGNQWGIKPTIWWDGWNYLETQASNLAMLGNMLGKIVNGEKIWEKLSV